ncbi:hypothetical protein QZH41_004313 [Actinostola sp. cb2023]|nr:hypothetical protein QZH41_004313 [Actinostola sp. cb2023]
MSSDKAFKGVLQGYSGRLDETVTRVRLQNTGYTTWAAPFIFQTLCKINVEEYPFDTQHCKIIFGAWQYNGNEVNIQNTKKLASIAKTSVTSGEWDVLNVEIQRKVLFYQCCPNVPYPEISFIIHMKRKPLFYVINLIIPNILISLLAFFSFSIPVECGERMSFGITVLLSMTVFMLLVADIVPPTSEAVSLIGVFYTFSITEVFLALIATGISFRVNFSYRFGDGLSPGLKHIVFKVIGPCLGFNVSKLQGMKRKRSRGNAENSNSHSRCKRASASDPNCHGGYNQEQSAKNASQAENGTDTENLLSLRSKIVQARMRAIDEDNYNDAIDRKIEEEKIAECRLAATIVDRLFLVFFLVSYTIFAVVILGVPIIKLHWYP